MVQHMKRDLFQPQLQTRRNVAFAIRQRRTRLARGSKRLHKLVRINPADDGRTLIPTHLDAFRVMPEEIELETKLPALFGANDLAKLVDEARLAVRREAHHLSFIAVMWKPEELRRRGVNDARRVGILNLAQHLDRVALADAPHRRDEVAKAIDRKQRGALERRDEEAARQMRKMMFDVVKLRAQSL